MKLINSRADIIGADGKNRVRIRGGKLPSAIVFVEPGDMISCCLFENAVIRCDFGIPILVRDCTITESSIEKNRVGTPDDSSIIIEMTVFRNCELPRAWYSKCVLDGEAMENPENKGKE